MEHGMYGEGCCLCRIIMHSRATGIVVSLVLPLQAINHVYSDGTKLKSNTQGKAEHTQRFHTQLSVKA